MTIPRGEGPVGAVEPVKRETDLYERFDRAAGNLHDAVSRVPKSRTTWHKRADPLLAEMNSVYELVEEEQPIPPDKRSPETMIQEAVSLYNEIADFLSSKD